MGLINSDGNYLVVTQVNHSQINVEVYETKEKFDNGLDPNFEKATPGSFYLGEDLPTALKSTNAYGTGGLKVWDNMVSAAEAVVLSQIAVDPTLHKIGDLANDWTLWTA